MNLYYLGSGWESGRLHRSHSLGIDEKQWSRADNQIRVPPAGVALVVSRIGTRHVTPTMCRSPTQGGQFPSRVGWFLHRRTANWQGWWMIWTRWQAEGMDNVGGVCLEYKNHNRWLIGTRCIHLMKFKFTCSKRSIFDIFFTKPLGIVL
jgi:hypothetical protein